jgi:hypothetical protein
MLPMLLAGAGLGLLKSKLVDEPQADAQRKLAATTAELSPWTGLTPTMPKEANALGSMMEGGLAGAQLGQSLKTTDMNQQLLQSKLNEQNAINPVTGMDRAGGKTDFSTAYLNSPEKKSSWFGF